MRLSGAILRRRETFAVSAKNPFLVGTVGSEKRCVRKVSNLVFRRSDAKQQPVGHGFLAVSSNDLTGIRHFMSPINGSPKSITIAQIDRPATGEHPGVSFPLAMRISTTSTHERLRFEIHGERIAV